MLVIRFSRRGRKNRAFYRIVLAEKSFPVQGRFIETLGSHDPNTKETILKEDRIKHWLEKGASCSDTVFNLLIKKGMIEAKKRPVRMPKPEVTEEEAAAPEAAAEKPEAAEKTKTEEAAEEAPKKEEQEPAKAEKPEEKKEEVKEEKPEEAKKEDKKEDTEKK
jgi:small subunit ribosomal protein S16